MPGGTDFAGLAGGVGSLFGGIGDLFSSGGYDEAAKYEKQNAALAETVNRIQAQQADREAYQLVGGIQSDVAGGGFSLSGSAIDLLRSNARAASLNKAMNSTEGQITVNSYKAKAAEYSAMASASTSSGIGGILGGAIEIGAAFL